MKFKITSVNSYLISANFDIIALQETWLDDTVNSNEITMNTDYNAIRFDRCQSLNSRTRGGGVLLLIENDIKYVGIPHVQSTLLEYAAFRIVGSRQLFIINVYVPPYDSLQSYAELLQVIESITSQYPKASFLVIGDFNCIMTMSVLSS